jgi:hypothetical protein
LEELELFAEAEDLALPLLSLGRRGGENEIEVELGFCGKGNG